ncbi:MAG: class I SAM-dependent methyltransferase [Methanobrevibacter sp.]|jgi:predicted O-methyltransferase YrrM|nr:class I SAM-dependent methyltransferase [Candidatus Methanoflexus mossambicus]
MKIKNIPEHYENELLNDISQYLELSEMLVSEQKFLNGIIRELKPKNILEVGVAAGASSLIILNAIKDSNDSFLTSIDYNEKYYRDSNKKTGFLVEKHMSLSLLNKWDFYAGGFVSKFIEGIVKDKGKFDLCLLDTVHSVPGELLDILMILPFMKENGIIILHDTNYNIYNQNGISNCVLFSILSGNKLQPVTVENTLIPNIGAIELSTDTLKDVDDIFNALTLPWQYLPKKDDFINAKELFSKLYSKESIELLGRTYDYYENKLNNDYKIRRENEEKRNNNLNQINKLNEKIKKLKKQNKKYKKEINQYKNRKVVKLANKLKKSLM